MKITELINKAKTTLIERVMQIARYGQYDGPILTKGETAKSKNDKPTKELIKLTSHLPEGSKILDYGAGYGRNSAMLREKFDVYAYDKFLGTNESGWKGVSNKLPDEKFDFTFTTFVLNVTRHKDMLDIIQTCQQLTKSNDIVHIVRSKTDLKGALLNALKSKNQYVKNYIQKYYPDQQVKSKVTENQTLNDDEVVNLLLFGYQSDAKKFQILADLSSFGFKQEPSSNKSLDIWKK